MRNIIFTIAGAIAGGAATGFATGGLNEAIIYSLGMAAFICLIYIIYVFSNRVVINFGDRVVKNDLKHVLEEVGMKIRVGIKEDNKTLLSNQTKELVEGITISFNKTQKQLFASAVTVLRTPNIGTLSISNINKAYKKSLDLFTTLDKATGND